MPGNKGNRSQIKPTKAEALLIERFLRGGCVRTPNPARRKAVSKAKRRKYKKGYEIRFVTRTATELRRLQKLLAEAGLKFGKPYRKARQIIQPVYGRQSVERFRLLLAI